MTEDRYLRMRDLMDRYDLQSPATIYNWIRDKGFPRTSRRGQWRLSQVEAWDRVREEE